MIGAAPFALGAVERHVGVAQQLVGLGAVGGRDGDAEAGADHDLMAEHVEGLRDRFDDAAGKLGRVGRPRADLNDRELVAAEAGDRIGAAHRQSAGAW